MRSTPPYASTLLRAVRDQGSRVSGLEALLEEVLVELHNLDGAVEINADSMLDH